MKKKMLSVRFQILLVCILSMLLMQIMLIVSYYQFREMKIETNSQHFSDWITQMAESVELNCSYLNGMVENIAYSQLVQDYLESNDSEYLLKQHDNVKNFIIPFAELNDGIKDIAIIRNNGSVININADINDIKGLVGEIPEKTLWYYTGINNIVMNNNNNELYFTVGTNVYSTSDFKRKEKMGTVLISFNMKSIFGFTQYQKNEDFPGMLIYDRNNQLFYSNTQEGITTTYESYFDHNGSEKAEIIKLKGVTYYIKTGKLDSLGGKIVLLIPKAELMQGLELLQEKMVMMSIITFILILLLSIYVTNNVVVPMKHFMTYLKKVGHGDLRMMKQPIKLKGATEMQIMSEEFNLMMEEINDLTHRLVSTTSRLYESEIDKKQSELEYMYSQINPHFLFNTLESIKGCAVDEEAEKTFDMVNSLGKMFRYCVRGGNIVSLMEEINVVNSYMHLQKIRFGNKLNFICSVSENLYQAAIPKMILQPLLENAVIHGVEANGAVTIWLEGELQGSILYFSIRDDGADLGEEKLQELQKNLKEKSNTAHVGISNVNNRLNYIYGEEYGVEIETRKGCGFCISLRFPYEEIVND